MKIIKFNNDIARLNPTTYHPDLISKAYELVGVLDRYYGENRDLFEGVDGGYVLIVDNKDDFNELSKHTGYEKLADHIFEFVDKWAWGYHALVLRASDHSVSILFKFEVVNHHPQRRWLFRGL